MFIFFGIGLKVLCVYFICLMISVCGHYYDGLELITDINNYKYPDGINTWTLCTKRNERINNEPLFIDKYKWESVFYRYYYVGPDHEHNTVYETIFLSKKR